MFKFKNFRSPDDSRTALNLKMGKAYLVKLHDAINTIAHLDSILKDEDITKFDYRDAIITTTVLQGQDFSVSLLFSKGHELPFYAKINKETK